MMENLLKISDDQLAHFERNGFFLVPNPLGAQGVRQVDNRQQEVEPEWERTEFPAGCNRLACQFLMIGEPVLQMVERQDLVDAARRILGVEEVHVGACGIGDASKETSGRRPASGPVARGRQSGSEAGVLPHRPRPARRQQRPLRVLPGSQHRPKEEVAAELLQLELATGTHDEMPAQFFARHPHEVEVVLDPRWTLVWTPSCWHATGLKTAAGPRRAMGWNYFPPGGRTRDLTAIRHVHPDWRDWSEPRQRLWGLID